MTAGVRKRKGGLRSGALQGDRRQPFFIAEAYTQRSGTFVPRAEALAACQGIVDGAYDHVPERAFYFAGGIAEVLAPTTVEGPP